MATAIEPVIEEVATNLDEAASAVRMLDARIMGAFTFGVVTGTVVGFVWGYRYNKTKLRVEIKKESEEEIAQMREYFQQRMIALQGEADKKQSAEVIVEERGYRPV
jgi:predicted secreted hydrolase